MSPPQKQHSPRYTPTTSKHELSDTRTTAHYTCYAPSAGSRSFFRGQGKLQHASLFTTDNFQQKSKRRGPQMFRDGPGTSCTPCCVLHGGMRLFANCCTRTRIRTTPGWSESASRYRAFCWFRRIGIEGVCKVASWEAWIPVAEHLVCKQMSRLRC